MESLFTDLSFLQKINYVYKLRINNSLTKNLVMKKILLIVSLFSLICFSKVFSQSGNDTLVYLITCGPGTETYSIYGHSAIRIAIPRMQSDNVYNWGVFDFDVPNFAWKFAKGRLNYSLGVESMQSFLQVYVYEKRYVNSQRINLTAMISSMTIAQHGLEIFLKKLWVKSYCIHLWRKGGCQLSGIWLISIRILFRG
jgi:hypothetical protein